MYFVAAGWTAFACLYTLITIPCGWKGQWARHGDFFITFIAFCFQMAIAAMSSINTIFWEQNYTDLIENTAELNIVQQLVMGVAFAGFGLVLPSMSILLF